tara:strand:- start:701 stop:1795 length:1095 start_codon:yes stop_codon:yes gene_type:complete
MKIAIDAINVRSDGGLTYLNEFLINLDKKDINKIFIFINNKSLIKIKDKKFDIIENPIFRKNFLLTNLWKFFFLNNYLKKNNCKKLIVMSGHYLGNFNPTFLVMQNALPFTKKITKKFPLVFRIKFFIQKLSHILSIYKKNNVIFVSNYIKTEVLKNFSKKIKYVVSHHAVGNKIAIRKKNKIIKKKKLKLIYVSQYNYHKNHINLLYAIHEINKNKIRVTLDCFGEDINNNFIRIKNIIKTNKIKGVLLKKSIDQEKLFKIYKDYDCHIFPSYCESFGLPLLESAKAGLLIMCSNLKSFEELLKKSAIYFNPNSKNHIKIALQKVINLKKTEFDKKITKSMQHSKKYIWKLEIKKIKKFMLKI